MVDFKKLSSPEYKQRAEERRKQEEIEEELRRHTASFTGHRLNKLGGYNMRNPTMLKLKEKLLEVIESLITQEDINRFITGGAIGTDQAAFWCVYIMKEKYPDIKNILAVPFKKQDKVWTEEQKKWYKKILNLADEIIYVDEIDKYKTHENIPIGDYSPKKMQKRNEYMIDKSRIVVAVYDGSKGGAGNCVNYARKWSGIIYRLDPRYDFKINISYGMYR